MNTLDMPFTIFLLGREDASQIATLESLCFESFWDAGVYSRVLPEERVPLDDVVKNFCPEGLPVELLVVGLMSEGMLLGYVSIRPVLAAQCAEVYNIAVQPALRGRGVGHTLLEAAISALDNLGVKEITLEVRAGNSQAIALYAKNGFLRSGIRPRYYPDGEDAVLMERLVS